MGQIVALKQGAQKPPKQKNADAQQTLPTNEAAPQALGNAGPILGATWGIYLRRKAQLTHHHQSPHQKSLLSQAWMRCASW